MVGLRSRSGHAADDVERAALIKLGGQRRARAEIEIGIGKCTARRGVHLHRRVDRVADLDGSGRLDLEHGIDRIDALLGDEHLAAHVLLGAGSGGVIHRRGDGVGLALRNIGGNNELKLAGVIRASRGEITLEDADRYARSGGARRKREVVGLRGRSVHTADDVERAALIELRDEIRARAEVQIGIGKGSARRGVHLHRRVDRVADLDGSGRLDLEHGIDRIDALLGDEHLAAHVLLGAGSGGIVHRRGDGVELSFRNVGGNDELELAGVIRALRAEIALEDADRDARSGGARRKREVVSLRGRSVHTADDAERPVLFELLKKRRARAEIEIGVSKGAARRGVHLHRRVDRVAVLDGGGRLDLEHGVDRIDALLGDEHLAAHVLFGHWRGGVFRRRGDGCYLAHGDILGDDELELAGVIRALRGKIALEDADRYARSDGARGQREVVGLRGRAVHARGDAELAARVKPGNELRARAEVQIGIGESAARRGVHLHRDIELVADHDGGGRLDLEHGVDRVRALLGDEHLAAHILLGHRRGGIARRHGNGIELAFRNVGGDDELKLAGVIGAFRGEITLEDADRYARAGSALGEREVVGLRARSGHTGHDAERAARVKLRKKRRARAEIEVRVSERTARRGVHLHRDVNFAAVFNGRGRLDLEHGVDLIGALLGDEQLAAHVLLVHRRGGIAHRRGNCRFRRGGRLCRRRSGRLLRRGSLGRFGRRRRRGRGSCLRSGRGLRRGGSRRRRSRFRRRRGRGLRGRRHGACAAGVVRGERRDNIPQRQTDHEQQHNDPGHCFVHIDALLNDLMGKSRKNSDAPPGKTKSEQPIGCSDGIFRIIAF